MLHHTHTCTSQQMQLTAWAVKLLRIIQIIAMKRWLETSLICSEADVAEWAKLDCLWL